MRQVKPLQKSHDGEKVTDSRYLRQDSAPDAVMFKMQGPLRLDKPLASDGSEDCGEQMTSHHYDQSMQNEDAQ